MSASLSTTRDTAADADDEQMPHANRIATRLVTEVGVNTARFCAMAAAHRRC